MVDISAITMKELFLLLCISLFTVCGFQYAHRTFGNYGAVIGNRKEYE